MKAMLTTSINFGLVNVPVKMYAATSSHDQKFSMYRDSNHEPVGQQWVGKNTGEVLEFADTIKGTEVDGKLVILTKNDFDGIAEDAGKSIDVLQFSPAEQINPLMLESPYYLNPVDTKNTEGYDLLLRVLTSTNRVGIVRYTTRGKTHMAVLRAQGTKLTLQNLAWADELRDPNELPTLKMVEAKPAMLAMAEKLVESMHADFDPDEFEDTYTTRLNELVTARAGGEELAPVEHEEVEDVSDLLAALEASIQRHPAGKGKGKAKKDVAASA